MLQLKIAIAACLLASVLLSTVATHAATYYVATNGNNGNPGTGSQPWRTVAYAVSRMSAGDTTYVRGGTYNEGMIRFRRSGTSAAPIKLLNDPGGFPIINFVNGQAPTYDRIEIKHASGSRYAMGWITIEGFEIRRGYNGIKYYNLHDSVIRRNWLHDTAQSAILGMGSTRVLITKNRINHNGPFVTNPSSTITHGIYVHGSALTITNNLIYDNLGYGLQQNGSSTSVYSSAKHAGPEFAGAANWIIANNTFAYSKNRGGMVLWGSRCTNARIENNIFYENGRTLPSYGGQGIDFQSSGTGNTIRNNLAFASGSGAMNFIVGGTQGTHYTQSGNIVNTLNPRFVNAPATLPPSPNFSMTSGSPAIDRGLFISSNRTSYAGTARPQGSSHDIGAYENTSSSAQLAAPMSLQVVN